MRRACFPYGSHLSPAPPRRLALTIAGALFMEGFDGGVILTSLPQIAQDLGERTLYLSAAVSAYLIAVAVFVPVSGWCADRYGARRVYCAAIIVFLMGSLACGLAASASALIAGRFVQGAGGAMMAPVGRIIVARSASKSELISVMSFMLVPGLMGTALGPLVGGFITTYASWRWNFFVNLPIGAVGLLLALKWIEPSPSDRRLRFDWLGFALIAGAASALQLACDLVGRRGTPWPLAAGLALSAVLLTLGYLAHARRRRDAVFPLELFRLRTFRLSLGAGGLARIGVFAPQFLLPAMLELAFGFNAFRAGLVTALAACGSFIMRPGLSFALRRLGFRRWLLGACVGASALTAGFGLFERSSPTALLFAYVLVFGVVRSALLSSLGALTLADVEHQDIARSTSAALLVQRLAQSFAVSLAASSLAISSRGRALDHADFVIAFLLGALAMLAAALGMRRLLDDDGGTVTGRRPAPRPATSPDS